MAETDQEAPLKRIIVPMPEALLEELNDFRFEARRQSQADAVRELMRMGLEVWKQQGRKGGKKSTGEGAAS